MNDQQLLPQGDLRLLESDAAQRLFQSRIPARFAYSALDGTPRVVPTWFHWTGSHLVMATFISGPHVARPSARLAVLRTNRSVAVSIDTDDFPPEALTIRGEAFITEANGVPGEYATAAKRYLGEEAAADYLAGLEHPSTMMARIVVTPTWVGYLDFDTRLPAALGGVGPR